MCVGFLNGYKDFKPKLLNEAIAAAVPGSAVSFNRIGSFHFAIFLGWAWPKGGDSEPIPLLCHLSGDASTKPMASVRLDDFRDIVQSCTIRVYNCKFSAKKRSQVILECLYRVGKIGYNPLTNNCEHFVRGVICGERVSYQTRWILAAPIVQVPRIVVSTAFLGAATSAASSSCISKLETKRSLGLLNPEMDLVEILVSNKGLNLKGIRLNASCTKDFDGSSRFPMQTLYNCEFCNGSNSIAVCKPCSKLCHPTCGSLEGSVTEGSCRCSHLSISKAATQTTQQTLKSSGTYTP